jgi:hypothetical protein
MAHIAEFERILAEQEAANDANIAQNSTCDKTYTREYAIFVVWVKSQPHLATQWEPFLTRNNIDLYFSRVISCRAGVKNTIGRVLNAFHWYADNREYIGRNPPFVIESDITARGMRAQSLHQKATGGTGRPGSDPHNALKDILPEADYIRIMEYIYRYRDDWGPAAVNFTWGLNGAVRGHSNRKLTLCDINLSQGFGPERFGPLARALLLILRKGTVHKDRHETDKQVCTWRHRDYRLCSNFSTAMYVIWKLSTNATINFLHEDRSKRASWWDIPLIDWEEYSGKWAATNANCVK